MIDTHAHLHDEKYDADREQVIRDTFGSGIEQVITIGTSVEESQQAIELARQYERMYATAGLHPHVFNEIVDNESALAELQSMVGNIADMAMDQKVVAIGEVGLDHYGHTEVDITPKQKLLQMTGFKEQIKIALHLKKPLVIHCRDAYTDCYEALEKMHVMSGEVPVIFHCYGGDVLFTKKLLGHDNVYLSFTGNITYPAKKAIQGTKDDIRESIRLIPMERMLTETDCPYLSPQAVRGTRNVPANVRYVVEEIASIKEKDTADVIDQVRKNTRVIFPVMFNEGVL